MLKRLKQIRILSAILLICATPLFAQEDRKRNFIGINPSVTVEPYYEKKELDVNIFPLVYQRTLTRRLDLRFTSILNLGIRNDGNAISHFGLETAVPLFLKKKETENELSAGFFIAPIVSLTRNRMEEHNNLGIWVELGYNLLFENRFAMTFGLQVGGTYFAYDDGQTKWGNHIGVKIIIGKWL